MRFGRRERDGEPFRFWSSLLRRKDTRREFFIVSFFFLVVIAFWISGRKPRPAPPAPRANVTPLAHTSAGPWQLDLLRLEDCRPRGIALAVVRAAGPVIQNGGNPVQNASIRGLTLDGGVWTGTAKDAADVPYASACGDPESTSLEPGQALAVLRFRGRVPPPLVLSLEFEGRRVQFPPVESKQVIPSGSSLAHRIFGH